MNEIQWILCWYEDNGYVNWSVYDTRESALNHAPWTHEDWSVVRYNSVTNRHALVYAQGRLFPLTILSSPSSPNSPLTIYSVPSTKLSRAESHYETVKQHVKAR